MSFTPEDTDPLSVSRLKALLDKLEGDSWDPASEELSDMAPDLAREVIRLRGLELDRLLERWREVKRMSIPRIIYAGGTAPEETP